MKKKLFLSWQWRQCWHCPPARSPLYFLHSTALTWGHNGWIILAEGLLLFALTFGITMGLGRKCELL